MVWVTPKAWWYGQMCQSLYLSIKILIHYILIWKWPHSFSVGEENGPYNITITVQNAFSVELYLFFYYISFGLIVSVSALAATVLSLCIRCDFPVQQKYYIQMLSAADLQLK